MSEGIEMSEQDLGAAIGAAEVLLDAVLEQASITRAQYLVLQMIAMGEPVDCSPAARDVLHEIDAKGLIDSASDGRSPVRLSKYGKCVFQVLLADVDELTRRLYRDMSEADRNAAYHVVRTIERADRLRADRMSGPEGPDRNVV
ncbi:MAG: hypothetical protein HOQ24_13685 [Mycobacteriaceae bacterium]|nr:hypothetical protein [Mycobacteriaceae bacterium]